MKVQVAIAVGKTCLDLVIFNMEEKDSYVMLYSLSFAGVFLWSSVAMHLRGVYAGLALTLLPVLLRGVNMEVQGCG